MNIIKDINPQRITPDEFIAVIEIEKGSKNKYEIDKETGMLILDRVLFTSTHYPANYGFVPLTHCHDGDPLDVFVFCSEKLCPLSIVKCKPIGGINMVDGGKKDAKIVAVPLGDPQYSSYEDISQMPKHIIDELMHFLQVYKQLEGKTTEIKTFYGASKAKEMIVEAIEMFKNK